MLGFCELVQIYRYQYVANVYKLTIILQKNDKFLWKTERIKKNLPARGYVMGSKEDVDIFAEKIIKGSRIRSRNSKYADFLNI